MTSNDCFLGVGKFGKYFWGGLTYAEIFWGYQNSLTIYGSACVSQSVSQSVSVKCTMRMKTKWHGMT